MSFTDDDLRHTSFDSRTFTHTDLANRTLRSVEFDGCTFDACALSHTRFDACRFTDCTFTDCDLTLASVVGTSFDATLFRSCRLMGVDWSGTGLHFDVELVGCNLDYTSFQGKTLRGQVFDGCTAVEANFTRTDLRKAVFRDCVLTRASFTGADLSLADFSTSSDVMFEPAQCKRTHRTRVSTGFAIALAEQAGLVVV